MEYAIIDGFSKLHAIIDMPQGQQFSWIGAPDMRVLASESFGVDESRDYADYRWDGETFVLTDEALARDAEAQLKNSQEPIEDMVERLVAEKLATLGIE